MTIPVEKRNNKKLCEFHREVGHNTDECMHLNRQIEELIKNGKLSHVIKELKQDSEKDESKTKKNGEGLASGNLDGDEDGMEGPMIIEAEIGGHFIHRIYVDGGSDSEILYEHCFNRLRPEVKKPNGSSYRTPHRLQWRNNMAHGTNIAAGRPGVSKIQAVPSTAHGMLKFPVPGGILTLRSSRIILLECTMVSGPEAQPFDIIQSA
ncbi:hypothetical protein Tco_1466045 [Tanacetum coccineum]